MIPVLITVLVRAAMQRGGVAISGPVVVFASPTHGGMIKCDGAMRNDVETPIEDNHQIKEI